MRGPDEAPTPATSPREDTPGLLERLRAGDPAAASRLFENNYPRLRQAVRLRMPRELRSRVDADDLVQTSLVKALGHLDGFEYRGQGSFLSWLVRIAERALIDSVRADARRGNRAARESVGDVVESGFGNSDPLTPSQHAMRNEDLELLERAIETLSPEDRELIVDNRILGVDLGTLADRYGKSKEAIRLKVFRARNRLAAWLERHG